MMTLSTSISFDSDLFRSNVAHELTFYLAAVVLVVLTAESCIRLLKRDSFGITVAVYVTVFAWYFVDPFINPEQYDYMPSSSLGQSYGQVRIVFNRIPRFRARCNTLDCPPAEFGSF